MTIQIIDKVLFIDMTSKVKRPEQSAGPKEDELFNKLVAMSTKFSKTQYAEAYTEIAALRKEGEEAKKQGLDTKTFMRELKR